MNTEAELSRCPRCQAAFHATERRVANTYDVMTDSYGLVKCPNCAYKAPAGAFVENKNLE